MQRVLQPFSAWRLMLSIWGEMRNLVHSTPKFMTPEEVYFRVPLSMHLNRWSIYANIC